MSVKSRILKHLMVVGLLWMPFAAAGEVGPTPVVPNQLLDLEGNFDNTIPWSDNAPVRYQQVFLGSEVGDIEIKQIRYRLDEEFGSPFVGTLTGVVVVLSSTDRAPDDLSLTFSENLGADATLVFTGDPTLKSNSVGSVPHVFDILLTLDSTFVFDADSGLNLLLDVTIADGPALSSFDAESVGSDSISRVYCWQDAECLTTDQAGIADTAGLVTMLLDKLIFSDGFESSDTSEWSTVEP